jgi:hypothetical protein
LFFVAVPRARLFLFQEMTMEWIGWAIVIAQIAALAAYRYAFGKWPLRLEL